VFRKRQKKIFYYIFLNVLLSIFSSNLSQLSRLQHESTYIADISYRRKLCEATLKQNNAKYWLNVVSCKTATW